MLAAAVYLRQHHVLQQKSGAEREHGDDNQQTAVQRVKSLGSVTLLSFSAANESWLPVAASHDDMADIVGLSEVN